MAVHSISDHCVEMKLRVRSLESRETLKIQVPDSCSVQHFIHLLSLAIFSSSSSIYLSLNRKDELQASSSLDSLLSLGVTSGDLVFYSFNPAAFSRPNDHPPIAETLENQGTPILSQTPVPNSRDEETLIHSQTLPITKPVVEEAPILSETLVSNSERKVTLVEPQTLGPYVQANPPKEAQEFSVPTGMDIDGGGVAAAAADGDGPIVVKSSFSEPCFLRKVLREEVGDDGNEQKLLVTAVHAVMLESGFVRFDAVSVMGVDRFHLSEENPVSMLLWYTLPELLDHGCDDSPSIHSVVLRVQRLGQFINIYGSLYGKRSTVYRVTLDKYRFAPTLDLVWTHSDSAEEKDRGSNDSYPDNEVFEFWKIVKDGLALPLLIYLCDNAGLMPPPCLMRLPTELKLKIFDLLPAVDLVNVGCVCSELRYLSSNNDLWKQRFVEEFGNVNMGQGSSTLWKDRFATWWEMKKKRKRGSSSIWKWFPSLDGPSYFPVIFGDPIPHPAIGGDYDRIPALGIPSPFGQPAHSIPSPFGQPARRYPRHPIQRNTISRCNLGGGFMG